MTLCNNKNINEWSYQRYERFFGNLILKDDLFYSKLDTILFEVNNGNNDLHDIANKSGCTYEECICKIKYLKNKLLIGNKYINTIEGKMYDISFEDETLLKKYESFIYRSHLQISEIVNLLPDTTNENKVKKIEEVFNDLMYLNEKNLLNGIILNNIDKEIIYYSVVKKQKAIDYVTINCPNCGAINDVLRNDKIRCEYCGSIVEDSHSYTVNFK